MVAAAVAAAGSAACPDPAALELDLPLLGRAGTWQLYPIRSVRDPDRNLFDNPPAKINEARVTMTIFDGRIVFDAENLNQPNDRNST